MKLIPGFDPTIDPTNQYTVALVYLPIHHVILSALDIGANQRSHTSGAHIHHTLQFPQQLVPQCQVNAKYHLHKSYLVMEHETQQLERRKTTKLS